MLDLHVRGADFVIMTQFDEVLDGVRLALTLASPAEILALLRGLVEEGIISEAYSQNLSLHRFTEGIAQKHVRDNQASKPGSDEIHSQRSTIQDNVTQAGESGSWKPGQPDLNDHNWTSLESVLSEELNGTKPWTKVHQHQLTDDHCLKQILEMTDKHYLIGSSPMVCDTQCTLRIDEVPELLRSAESMQKLVSDSERNDEGNLGDRKEWLEQVEEAARRIAVPLWQHWDRGRSMLLPLVPQTATGCLTSENTMTAHGAVLTMEEETQHAVACRTLDWYTDAFREVDTGGATTTPEDLFFSTDGSSVMTRSTVDHFAGEAGNASPVVAWTADKNIADMQGDHLTTKDLLCLTADPQCCTDADLFYSNAQLCMTSGIANNSESVSKTAFLTCSSGDLADFLESKDDGLIEDSHWGKFAFNHHQIPPSVLILL